VTSGKGLGFEEEAILALETVGYLINYLQQYQVATRQASKLGKDETAF
jgi:hypothetical protein